MKGLGKKLVKKPLVGQADPLPKSCKVPISNGVLIKSFPGIFLLSSIILTLIWLIVIFRPFISALVLSAIIATAFYPVYQFIEKKLKGRSKWASFLTCLIIVFGIIVPLTLFLIMLGQQAWGAYKFVDENIQAGGFFADLLKWEEGSIFYDSFVWVQGQLGQYVNLAEFDIWANIKDAGQSIADWLTKQVGNLASGLLFFGINLFIFVFALYYFFKDSGLIVDKIMSISPLPKKHEYALLAKFKDISYGTLYGIFLASVIQGILGGIGFTIVGIPNAVFWGAAIAIFSLVPVFGTGVIWVPAGIILLVQSNYVGGIFLLAWGVLLISTVDNFLRAYFIGERTNMNQLLTFLAVIGGLWYFGLAGVIFGPLILNIFLTLLSIYESEYDNVLHPHDE